jgi:hypothetical protein
VGAAAVEPTDAIAVAYHILKSHSQIEIRTLKMNDIRT